MVWLPQKYISFFYAGLSCAWRSALPPYLPQPGVQTGSYCQCFRNPKAKHHRFGCKNPVVNNGMHYITSSGEFTGVSSMNSIINVQKNSLHTIWTLSSNHFRQQKWMPKSQVLATTFGHKFPGGTWVGPPAALRLIQTCCCSTRQKPPRWDEYQLVKLPYPRGDLYIYIYIGLICWS